jgi:hypothetical protein
MGKGADKSQWRFDTRLKVIDASHMMPNLFVSDSYRPRGRFSSRCRGRPVTFKGFTATRDQSHTKTGSRQMMQQSASLANLTKPGAG